MMQGDFSGTELCIIIPDCSGIPFGRKGDSSGTGLCIIIPGGSGIALGGWDRIGRKEDLC